jgi:hypothetical protein
LKNAGTHSTSSSRHFLARRKRITCRAIAAVSGETTPRVRPRALEKS